MPGFNVNLFAENGCLARNLQVDRLRALAAAIRFGVEAYLLVFRQSGQSGSLHGGNVNEDVRAALVRLDESEALVGVEEFYSPSLGHASGPLISARHPHGQHTDIASSRRR